MFRSQKSTSKGGTNRGSFLRGSRQPTASTKPRSASSSVSRKPQLSPLKENSPSRPKQQFTGGHAASRMVSGESQPSSRAMTTATAPSNQYFDNTSIGETYGVDAGFSHAEIQELRESFKLFDVSNAGSILVGDLRNILETLLREQRSAGGRSSSPHHTNPRLDMLLNRLSDLPDDETLTMEGFMDLMATTMTIHQNDDDNDDEAATSSFAPVFRLFDTEGKGFITLEDLERVAIELGEHDMTRGELEEMIARAGSLQDGRVGLDEFTRMMTLPLFHRGGGDGQEP